MADRSHGATGSRVGNYELIAEVAETALGVLSVGRALVGHERGRLALLRRLERGRPLGDSDLAAVRESAISALRIHDPGVLAVLELLPVKNGLVIVSEYIEGLPLRTVLEAAKSNRTPLPGPIAARLASDLLRAVLGAKRALAEATLLAPLVGLTPDAVLLASSGDVLISGLGLAVLARPIDSPALLAYRSPEHFSGSAPDERSEVYSVGVLLWELFAGKNPLVGDDREPDRAQLVHQIRTVGLPRLDRAAPASLSPAVAELVMQAVARNPAQRIPSLEALANALTALGKSHNVRVSDVLKALDPLVRPSLERLRAALETAQQGLVESAPGESLRPTFRPPAPAASRTARPIGLAAFPRVTAPLQIEMRPPISSEAARKVDDLLVARSLPALQPPPAEPLPIAVATLAGSGPAPQTDRQALETAVHGIAEAPPHEAGTGAGLPVGTTAPIPLMAPTFFPASTRGGAPPSSSTSRARLAPAEDVSAIEIEGLRPRRARRLAAALIVLLVLGAAFGIGVLAVNRMQRSTASSHADALPGLPPPRTEAADEPAPATTPATEERAEPVEKRSDPRRPRAPVGFRPRVPLGQVAAPVDPAASEPAPAASEAASPAASIALPSALPSEPPPAPELAPGVALPPPAQPRERAKEPLEENPY